MSAEAIGAFIGGLFTCYWAGYKFGVVVAAIKKLGTSA